MMKKALRIVLTLLAVCALILAGFIVFVIIFLIVKALGFSQSSYTVAALIEFILSVLISYRYRDRDIGGWLLFYYISLYLSGIYLIKSISILVGKYSLQGLKIFPAVMEIITLFYICILIVNFIVSTLLLAKNNRNEIMVNLLRRIFLLELIVLLASMFTSIVYFNEFSIRQIAVLLGPLLWYCYFTYSLRVKYVLVNNEWDYNDFLLNKGERETYLLEEDREEEFR